MLKRLAFAIAAVLLCTSAQLFADSALHLKDGRVFYGTVVERDRREIAFDTVVSNIQTVLRFSLLDIDRIEDNVVAPQIPSGTQTDEIKPKSEQEIYRIGLIRLEGVVGFDEDDSEWLIGPSLLTAMQYAYNADVDKLVLIVDTPGGSVVEATALAEIIQQFRKILPVDAIIDRSISAGIWLAFACDNVYVTPSSEAGAAVPFDRLPSGDLQVDAKFQAAQMSKVAKIAASGSGVPYQVVHAMIRQGEWLLAKHDAGGKVLYSDQAHLAGKDGWQVLDDGNSVLAMTGIELVKWGIAKGVIADEDDLLTSLAPPDTTATIVDFTGRFKWYNNRIRTCYQHLEQERIKASEDKEAAALEYNRALQLGRHNPRSPEFRRAIKHAEKAVAYGKRGLAHHKGAQRNAFELAGLANVEFHYRKHQSSLHHSEYPLRSMIITAKCDNLHQVAEYWHNVIESYINDTRSDIDIFQHDLERLVDTPR